MKNTDNDIKPAIPKFIIVLFLLFFAIIFATLSVAAYFVHAYITDNINLFPKNRDGYLKPLESYDAQTAPVITIRESKQEMLDTTPSTKTITKYSEDSCYMYEIKEEDFESKNCYSYEDFYNLASLYSRYKSISYEIEWYEKTIDITCNSKTKSFKDMCKRYKEEFEELKKTEKEIVEEIEYIINKY